MTARTAVGAAPATVAAHGLSVMLPDRWEARLYLRDAARQVTLAPDEMNTDLHASAEYRAHLIPILAARAVERAR